MQKRKLKKEEKLTHNERVPMWSWLWSLACTSFKIRPGVSRKTNVRFYRPRKLGNGTLLGRDHRVPMESSIKNQFLYNYVHMMEK